MLVDGSRLQAAAPPTRTPPGPGKAARIIRDRSHRLLALPGGVCPSSHILTHTPLEQTRPMPQAVPFGASVVLHTGAPVEQLVVPGRQVVPHRAPAVQAPHDPLSQTWLEPQAVPFGALLTVLQKGLPLTHSVTPLWQTLPPGVHAAPETHALRSAPEDVEDVDDPSSPHPAPRTNTIAPTRTLFNIAFPRFMVSSSRR